MQCSTSGHWGHFCLSCQLKGDVYSSKIYLQAKTYTSSSQVCHQRRNNTFPNISTDLVIHPCSDGAMFLPFVVDHADAFLFKHLLHFTRGCCGGKVHVFRQLLHEQISHGAASNAELITMFLKQSCQLLQLWREKLAEFWWAELHGFEMPGKPLQEPVVSNSRNSAVATHLQHCPVEMSDDHSLHAVWNKAWHTQQVIKLFMNKWINDLVNQ